MPVITRELVAQRCIVRVAVIGIIGAGKTELVKKLSPKNVCVSVETPPTTKALDAFYKGMSTQPGSTGDASECELSPTFLFERSMLETRLRQVEHANAAFAQKIDYGCVCALVTDRHPIENVQCFWPVTSQYMSENERQKFVQYMDDRFAKSSSDIMSVDAIIYVDTSPQQCLENIRQRNRPGEETITLDYLTQLQQQYKKLITSYYETMGADALPVLTLPFVPLDQRVRLADKFIRELIARRQASVNGAVARMTETSQAAAASSSH